MRLRNNIHMAPEIGKWKERVHKTGTTFDDVAELERILKKAIDLGISLVRTSLTAASIRENTTDI